MGKYHMPIFCNKCSSLALAKLDDSPLCLSCLLETIKVSGDPYLVDKTQPLELNPMAIKGSIKSRSRLAYGRLPISD